MKVERLLIGRLHLIILVICFLSCFFCIGSISSYFYNDDNVDYFFPLMTEAGRQIMEGQYPLWNKYVYLGYPLMGDMQAMALYPFTLLSYLSAYLHGDITLLLGYFFIYHIFLIYLSMYFLLRSYNFKKSVSIISAISYCFNGFLLSVSSYWIVVLPAFLYLPFLIFLARLRGVRKNNLLSIVSGVSYGIFLLAGYPENVFFLSLILAIVLFHASYTFHSLTPIKHGIITLVLGLLIASPLIYEGFQLYRFSNTGNHELRFDAFVWGYPSIKAVLGIVYPNIKGDWIFFPAVESSKFFYKGGIAFFLIIPIFYKLKNSRYWLSLFIFFLIMLLGASTPFTAYINRVLFDIPILNKSHWAMKHFLEFHFLSTILVAIGMNSFLKKMNSFKMDVIIFSLILFILGIGIIFIDKKMVYREKDWLDVFYFLPSLLVFIYLIKETKRIYFIAILVLFPLFYNFKLIKSYEFYHSFKRVPISNYLTSKNVGRKLKMDHEIPAPVNGGSFNVAANYGALSRTLAHNLRTVFVYNKHAFAFGDGMFTSVVDIKKMWNNYEHKNLFSLYGIETITMTGSVFSELMSINEVLDNFDREIELRQMDKNDIKFLNKRYKGLIYSPDIVNGVEEVSFFKLLNQTKVDLSNQIYVKGLHGKFPNNGKLEIKDIEILPGKIKAIIRCEKKCFAVFSFLNYPGWKLFINNENKKIYEVNDIVIGTFLEEGISFIELKYQNGLLITLAWISTLTLLISLIIIIFTYIPHSRRSR